MWDRLPGCRHEVTIGATGGAAPAAVWQRYRDPARWTDWAPQIRDVVLDTAVLQTGASGRVIGPVGIAVPFVVTHVDESQWCWSWRVGLGIVDLELDHGVERSPARAHTWVRIRGPLPLIAGYLPVAKLAVQRLVTPAAIGPAR